MDCKTKIFIHSALDDAGLTPNQLQVLSHVARRAGRDGQCFESIVHIARHCGLKADTIRACVKELVRRRIIRRTDRTGDTSLLTVNHTHAEWLPPLPKKTPPPKREGSSTDTGDPHPSRNGGDKDNPVEGNPLKGQPPSPSNQCGPKLFPREHDNKIEHAKRKILELQGHPSPENDALIDQLRKNISNWESEKLGVKLPFKKPSKPAVKPKVPTQTTHIPPPTAEELKRGYQGMRDAVDNHSDDRSA